MINLIREFGIGDVIVACLIVCLDGLAEICHNLEQWFYKISCALDDFYRLDSE